VRRRPLRPVSARRYQERKAEAAFRRAVHDRARGLCEAEPILHAGIPRRGVHVHHIFKRSRAPGLRLEPENGLLLCRSCHDFTEEHPQDSLTLGLLGHSWDAPPRG
jgi:5-methylcytosine-specific restriction endonuclease McrA